MDNSPLHWRPRRAGQVQRQGGVATKRGGKDNHDYSESDEDDDVSESNDDNEVKTRARLRLALI